MGNLQQAAMIACNLFTCRNGGPYRCRHCRADLSHLLRVIGVNHANILEGLPEPTDAPLMTREEWAEAERDHYKRALEWLGGHVDRTNKDCPPEPYNDEDPTPEFPQEKAPEGTVCWAVALECVRCWCRAALAATKEPA